ncbi:MAG: preprotein translocase subunit SecG [Candidatus Omnitrophica bacterium]|nr:preprotein translocase subunit SecG [Candidatus Omnitrophota bacterium]
MYNLVLTIHVIVVISLIGMILVQRGRSGGLVEALGGVESIFGTKTNNFFVKVTVTLAIGFFLTSISLAYLSKEKGKSLMGRYKNVTAEVGEEGVTEVTVKDASGNVVPDSIEEISISQEPASLQESSSIADEGVLPLSNEE